MRNYPAYFPSTPKWESRLLKQTRRCRSPEELEKQKIRVIIPAGAGDEAEGVRREPGALVELEHLQHVPARLDEHGDVVVGDGHAAEVERLEAIERRGELGDPGRGVGAEVLGDDAVHGGAGPPLERERLEAREPGEQPRGLHGVAEPHGDVLARERVDAVPAAAHERGRLPVARVVHVAEHEVQSLLGDAAAAEAERAAQLARLRHLAAHRDRGARDRRLQRGAASPEI